MKKYFGLFAALALCTTLSSFTAKPGGDVFEIYLNGKQVIQQFVHVDKTVKTLHFATLNASDKIEVLYSHCGQMGTNRVIHIRNEKGEMVKELRFPEATSKRSLMAFTRGEISRNVNTALRLYYSSKELPQERLLATLDFSSGKVAAQP